MKHKDRLGDILLNNNIVTVNDLTNASEYAVKNNLKLGQALLHLNVLDEEQLILVLSEQLNIPRVNLNDYSIKDQISTLLPENIARKCHALLLDHQNGVYIVGFVDPLDIESYDLIAYQMQAPIDAVLIKNSELQEVLDRIYSNQEEIDSFAQEVTSIVNSSSEFLKDLSTNINVSSAPIVKLLNSLISDAIKSRASDIHIEPARNKLRIRFRIDGELNETILDDVRIANILIQILKLKAKLNITETRFPQDGRFDVEIMNKKIDVRLATIPTSNGESCVLRLLDQSKPINELSMLGMKPAMIERIYKLITDEHGMILLTGPTGSGKTTTLYSILQRLNKANRKIITVEDPVEYTMDRINQIQVNHKINLDFKTVLRSVLRHDPDIIMVGEIRDRETSRIAMRAAITGHLVLATLHTNDALNSVVRLVDIGQEGYVVASALKAILSQRLIKLNCSMCTGEYQPSVQEIEWLTEGGHISEDEYQYLKKGAGCKRCHHTGYFGRVAVYELLELDHDMADALRCDSIEKFVAAARRCAEYKTLLSESLIIAKQGKVSVSELMRVFGELVQSK